MSQVVPLALVSVPQVPLRLYGNQAYLKGHRYEIDVGHFGHYKS